MKNLFIMAAAVLVTATVSAQQRLNQRSAEELLNEKYCSGLFQSTDGNIIDVASNPTATAHLNIFSWLQGRVSGLQVYQTNRGIAYPVLRNGVPAIFVDEVQVSPSYVNMVQVADIAIVKVIKTPFFGGFNGGSGAIAIYTHLAEEEETEDDSGK